MIIMQNKSGMLANRLFAFSHFIANAIEHQYVLVNPTFGEYCQYFYATRNNDFGDLPIYVRLGINIPFPLLRVCYYLIEKTIPKSTWHVVIKFSPTDLEKQFDLNRDDFLKIANQKVVLTNGWLFRDHKNHAKHSETIRKLFTPDQQILNEVNNLISYARNQGDILIGVHLRKGDYKEWRGGKYYFTDEIYAGKMFQLVSHFGDMGKQVTFWMCSNEVIDEHNFDKYNILLGPGHVIKDLYSLSKCDYIIGPPSTYSRWASFYGKVPLLRIKDPVQRISVEDFLVVQG